MKVVKTASGTEKVTMSKREWQDIGKKANWMKEDCGECKKPCNCSDLREVNGMKLCPQCLKDRKGDEARDRAKDEK